ACSPSIRRCSPPAVATTPLAMPCTPSAPPRSRPASCSSCSVVATALTPARSSRLPAAAPPSECASDARRLEARLRAHLRARHARLLPDRRAVGPTHLLHRRRPMPDELPLRHRRPLLEER